MIRAKKSQLKNWKWKEKSFKMETKNILIFFQEVRSFCALFLSVSKCTGEGTGGCSEVGYDRCGRGCCRDGGTDCRPRTSSLARDSMILVDTAQILVLMCLLFFARWVVMSKYWAILSILLRCMCCWFKLQVYTRFGVVFGVSRDSSVHLTTKSMYFSMWVFNAYNGFFCE